MDRLKQFLIYFLLFVGFFAISLFLENGLIEGMYGKLASSKVKTTEQLKDINGNEIIEVEVEKAKASRVNGYVHVNIKNTSGKFLEKVYAKVDLLNAKGRVLATKYIDIENFEANEERKYEIQFKANDVVKYEFSLMTELPNEELLRRDSIINLFGYELDLTNVLNTGINLRDFFGIDLVEKLNLDGFKDLVTLDGLKNGARSLINFGVNFATSLPPWAYFGAAVMIMHFW